MLLMTKKSRYNWQQIIAIVISVIAVLGFGVWYWYGQVYLNPQNVFWSTIDQNLKTASVTKTINHASEDSSGYQQITTTQYKSKLIVSNTVIVQNNTNAGTVKVVTETIGTPNQDFLRYKEIMSPTNNVNKDIVGIWSGGKKDEQSAQILPDVLLSSPIIFGYINKSQRAEIINKMKDQKVFKIDFAATNTKKEYNNKKAYGYDVEINLVEYIDIYKDYLIMIGQNNLAKQLSGAGGNSIYKVKLIISPSQKHILNMTPNGMKDSEVYFNYDVNNMLNAPKDVKLSINDLQKRLQKDL